MKVFGSRGLFVMLIQSIQRVNETNNWNKPKIRIYGKMHLCNNNNNNNNNDDAITDIMMSTNKPEDVC